MLDKNIHYIEFNKYDFAHFQDIAKTAYSAWSCNKMYDATWYQKLQKHSYLKLIVYLQLLGVVWHWLNDKDCASNTILLLYPWSSIKWMTYVKYRSNLNDVREGLHADLQIDLFNYLFVCLFVCLFFNAYSSNRIFVTFL